MFNIAISDEATDLTINIVNNSLVGCYADVYYDYQYDRPRSERRGVEQAQIVRAQYGKNNMAELVIQRWNNNEGRGSGRPIAIDFGYIQRIEIA